MLDQSQEREISELKARIDTLSQPSSTPQRPKKKRPTIALLIGGMLAVIVVGSAMNRRNSTEVATETANSLADDAGRDKASSSPSPGAQAAFVRMNTAFLQAARPCDEAQAGMSRAVQTENRYATYNAAQRVKSNCSDTSDAILKLSFPAPISAPAATSLMASMKKCADDYTARYSAADTMAKTFDGDMRPSDIAEARQQNGIARLSIQECITGYVATAEAAGFTIPRHSDKVRHHKA